MCLTPNAPDMLVPAVPFQQVTVTKQSNVICKGLEINIAVCVGCITVSFASSMNFNDFYGGRGREPMGLVKMLVHSLLLFFQVPHDTVWGEALGENIPREGPN